MSACIRIESCGECRDKQESRHYTGDSFEIVFDWRCGKKDVVEKGKKVKRFIGYSETFEKDPPVPKWCPKRVFGREK